MSISTTDADRILPLSKVKLGKDPIPEGTDPLDRFRFQVTVALEVARRAGYYDAQDWLASKYADIRWHPDGAKYAKEHIPEQQEQRQYSVMDQLLAVAELLSRLGCLLMAHEISFAMSNVD